MPFTIIIDYIGKPLIEYWFILLMYLLVPGIVLKFTVICICSHLYRVKNNIKTPYIHIVILLFIIKVGIRLLGM